MADLRRLLIIEDNPADVAIIQRTLRDVARWPARTQFDLVRAEMLEEALEVFKTQTIDVVLSDLNLPDSNGLDTLRAITAAAPDVPVVVLTGSNDDSRSVEALQAGAQDYLVKGQIDSHSLDRSIRYAMERKRAEQDRAQLLLEQAARAATEHSAELMRQVQYVTDATLANLTSEKLIPELLNRLTTILRADMSAILFLEVNQMLTLAGSRGLEEGVPPNIRISVGEGFAGRVAQQRTALVLDDPDGIDILPGSWEKGLHSALGAPLIAEGKLIGVVEVGARQPGTFTAEEQQLLQMVADRIAHAIEHVRLYKAEQKARLAAEEASRAKDQFLAVISHELRTPLTPITGWIKLLRDNSRQVPRETGLDVIDRNVRLLARIIDDLLNLSAERFGTFHLQQKHAVDLKALLSQVAQAAAQPCREKGIELSLELPPASISIRADRERLVQAFGNILNNAVKFTPAGGKIWVTVSHQSDRIVVRVQDNGIGIRADFLPHIFDPFRQADASSTRPHGGLGLGLSIAQQIICAHGGAIQAESAGSNAGTIFTIELVPEPIPAN